MKRLSRLTIAGLFIYTLLMSRYFPPATTWANAAYVTTMSLIWYGIGTQLGKK